MKSLGLALVLGILTTSLGPLTASAAPCNFVLGFQVIRDEIPEIVGECVVDQHYNPENGDALQETTGGLLVWRKTDNFTAFTDGFRSWVNGPYGLQERLNTDRFDWERESQSPPPPTTPQPPSSPAQPPSQSEPAPAALTVSATSPVSRGGTATATARAASKASCTITVPNQADPSTARGLFPKNTDPNGVVSWSWTVGPNATPGTWPISVVCSQSGRVATANTSLTIE